MAVANYLWQVLVFALLLLFTPGFAMSRLPAILEITAMLVVAVLVVFSGSTASKTYLGKPGRVGAVSISPLDDGWRRTALGWEQTSQWDLPQAISRSDSPSKERISKHLSEQAAGSDITLFHFNLHPAWFVCLLLLLAGTGFVLFPSQAREERQASPEASPGR